MSALPDTRAVSISTAGYEDGLGRRSVRFDREVGGMLECLRLRPELRAFEPSLRERAEAISRLEDERFVPVRAIERDAQGLIVVSELVAGERLLDVIEGRQREAAPVFGIDAALGLLLQTLPALSTLHTAGMAHGVVSPGRLLVTPAAQIVLLDSIYGAAVERLNLNRAALWSTLGVLATPAAGATRLDRQTDVLQAALCALILATGKTIESGEPARLTSLVREAAEVAEIRAGAEFAVRVRQFFTATLPLSAPRPVITTDDAAFEARNLAALIGEESCHAALAELTRAFEPPKTVAAPPPEPRLVIVHNTRTREDRTTAEESSTAAVERAPVVEPPSAPTVPLPPPVAKPPARDVAEKATPSSSRPAAPVVPVVPEAPAAPAAPPAAAAPRVQVPAPPPVVPPAPPAAAAPPPGIPAAPPAAPAPPPAPPATAPAVAPTVIAPPAATAPPALMAPPAAIAPPPAPTAPAPPQAAAPPPIAVAPPIAIPPPPVYVPPSAPHIGIAAPPPVGSKVPPAIKTPPPAPSIGIAVTPPVAVRVRQDPPPGYTPARPEPDASARALPFVDRRQQDAPARFPWKIAAAALLVLAVGIVAGRAYLPSSSSADVRESATETVSTAGLAPGPAPAEATTGGLSIESQPAGATVTIDGRDVGVTPIKIDALAPGRHTVVITSGSATVRRTVRIEAGQSITLDVPVYSGWVAVFSPISLEVATGGRTIGNTETGKIMLPPGKHVLTLSNRELGYTETRSVEIHPGEERPLNVEPKSAVNINAHPWAEVWVDGRRAGETPLANLPVLLGTRVFVFKHPQFGERRITRTIGTSPVAITVDLTRPE